MVICEDEHSQVHDNACRLYSCVPAKRSPEINVSPVCHENEEMIFQIAKALVDEALMDVRLSELFELQV